MSDNLNNNNQNTSSELNNVSEPVKTTADDFDYLLNDDFLKDTETVSNDGPPIYRKNP